MLETKNKAKGLIFIVIIFICYNDYVYKVIQEYFSMNKTNKYLLIPLGLLSMTALSGVLLMSSSVNADNDSVVDEINITVPVSCTMSGSGMTSHTASIPNGTYNSNIGETTITAFCNDNSGFAIYAIGYTDDTDGKNVLTDSVDTNNDIDTGTATAPVGGNDNSNWAMKLSTVTSPTPTYPITIQNSFDSFHNVPDDYALVAKRTEGTDVGQQAEGSTIKSTYQAYISKTQPAGTYNGQVKYVMVHPNDATAPEIQVACNPSGTTISTITCMQDINAANKSAIFASMSSNQQYTLIDKRDSIEYTVAKLADGNIWMTKNLDIAGGTELSYEDTDFESTYTLPTTNGWTTNDGKLVLPASSTSGFNDDNFAYVYNSGSIICGDGTPCYSYYSWDAATLGSGRSIGAENTDADYSICPKGWKLPTARNSSPQFNATLAEESDFYNLAVAYGMTAGSWWGGSNFYNNAGPDTIANFSLAGYYDSVGFTDSGYGHYWPSTGSHSNMAYSFYFGSSWLGTNYYDDYLQRDFGYSVRCLVSNT